MTNKTDIIYKDIPNFEGLYKVSNTGKIFSNISNKHLKPSKNRGYERVSLCKNGKIKDVFIHQAVLWAFVGVQPKGIEVRHLNSDPSDNRLENLCYGTKSENMQDAVAIGTLVFSRSNLSVDDVNNIAKSNGTIKEIAQKFNCHRGTVQAIKTGKSFKNFVKEINYCGRDKIKLSESELNFIRDRNNNRKYIIEKTGLSINQIKRIRQGNDCIYIS